MSAKTAPIVSLIYLSNIAVLLWLVPYALVCCAALKFEQRRGRLNSPTSIAAVLGVLSIGVAIVIHVVWPVDKVARIGAWVTVGLVLAGFVVIGRGRAESRFNGSAPSV